MDLILQMSVGGAVAAVLYGLFGLSFSFIFATTRIMHFAHGATYTVAIFLFYSFHALAGVPLFLSTALTVLALALFGSATMAGFYEPFLRKAASPGVVMIASLGLFIAVESVAALIFGTTSRVVSSAGVSRGYDFGGVYVTALQMWTVAIALASIAVMAMTLQFTTLGRSIRGISDDPALAADIGINVIGMRRIVFALGSGLLAVGAVLVSLDVGVVPGSSLRMLLIAATASIIGGSNSIYGGLVGGLAVGFLEGFGLYMLDPQWLNVMIFSALILILLLQPAGLLRLVK